jgi:hypothetical protein
MTPRESFIAGMSLQLKRGVALLQDAPYSTPIDEIDRITKQCEAIMVLLLKAEDQSDDEWERDHPARGSVRRFWMDASFKVRVWFGLYKPEDPTLQLAKLIAEGRVQS